MKLIALILAFIFCFIGSAVSESAATPTDLIEIEEEEELIEIDDDDWGEIDIEFERQVFLTIGKDPQYLGDEMILIATLVNFKPKDNYEIFWQYSTDEILWIPIDGEHEKILTVTIDENNYDYWWRVLIKMEE